MTDTLKLPPTLHRSVTIEERAADKPLSVAISSEAPVDRWFGTEILEHSKKAIDLKRLKRGLPLLMDHDQRKVVGRIENITLGDDKVLRGEVRFSESPEGVQCEKDMRSGIRPDISVGYAIDEMLENRKDETYTAVRWRPLEASSVAVPADESVGVGRAADRADADIEIPVTRHKETTMPPETVATPPEVRLVNDPAPERKRTSEILELGEKFKLPAEKVRAWIADGASTEQIRGEVLEIMRQRAAAAETVGNTPPLNEREDKQYSLRRAFLRALDTPQAPGEIGGFEGEVHQDLMKKRSEAGLPYKGGLIIPSGLRTGVVGTSSLGGALRFTEHGDFIEMLRNATFLGKAGARIVPGLQGNVAMPKQLTGGTAFWLAEAGTVTNADLTFGLVTLSPKTLQYSYGVTRQFLAQSAEDVEAIIRADYANSQLREVDRVGLVGTSTANEPTGVVNVSGITLVTVGTNGGAITWDLLTRVPAAVAVANGILNDTAAFVTNGKVAHALKNTFKGTAGFMPIWADGALGGAVVDGTRAFVSTTAPSNLTKGTSTTVCSLLAYASAWNEMLIGQWGGGGFAEVLVDPYSQKKLGIVELTSYALLDIQVRNAASFGVIKDITTTL